MNDKSKILAKRFLESGLLKIKNNDFAGALHCFKNAIELDSELAEAHRSKGFAEMEQSTDPFDFNDHHGYNNAVGDFDMAIELDPGDAESFFGRGLAIAWGFQNFEKAIENISKAININPHFDDAYYSRGVIKKLLADIEWWELDSTEADELKIQALADLNMAIKLNPEFPRAYYLRGEIKEEGGDYSGALNDYDKAIYLDRLNSYVYYKRSLLKDKLGDSKGANEDYNKMVKIDPENKNHFGENEGGIVKKFLFKRFSPITKQKGIFKYFYYVHYYPVRYKLSGVYEDIRKFIYDFKEGRNSNEVAIKIAEDIISYRRKDWWLCIIPASTQQKTDIRFKKFCDMFCLKTKMNNGYSLISNKGDRGAVHLQEIRSTIEILDFIAFQNVAGKKILLFDDLYTTGNSFLKVAQKLKSLGATEVVGLFLGKTHWVEENAI